MTEYTEAKNLQSFVEQSEEKALETTIVIEYRLQHEGNDIYSVHLTS